MALLFPTAAQAATQTPVNTFSPTSTPLANTSNAVTYTYNTTLGVWTAAGAAGGSFVPQDSPTGAASMPTGTDAQRAAIAAPVVGMQRYNTDTGYEEIYTGATFGWKKVAWNLNPATPADLTISANTVLSDGIYSVNNLTIAAGATVTTNGQMIVFECTGTATIAGTVNLNSSGPRGAVNIISNFQNPFVIGGGGNNIGGGQNGTGGRPYAAIASQVGSGGATGVATISTGGSVGGGGGGPAGGGFIVRASKGITVTGTITATGGNGDAAFSGVAPFAVSGAGGGSGGVVILRSDETIDFSGTINVSGGDGATGVFTAPFAGADGGGGGGGGIVILQSTETLTNTGTITLTAGATGAGTGGALGSGGGGACGGSGGTFATPAGAGKLLFSGSPI